MVAIANHVQVQHLWIEAEKCCRKSRALDQSTAFSRLQFRRIEIIRQSADLTLRDQVVLRTRYQAKQRIEIAQALSGQRISVPLQVCLRDLERVQKTVLTNVDLIDVLSTPLTHGVI